MKLASNMNQKVKLTSILKPYIMPVTISSIIILIYAFIRYMELGSFKTVGENTY